MLKLFCIFVEILNNKAMGSWSVYCGTSNIAITAGQECVLLPLKKSDGGESEYLPYLPATLPIFGEYDDYGGLENIKQDENTKLIEEHFGISILNFTKIFTDWVTYQRSEMKDVIKNMRNYEEMKDWKFMFIDKKVYDFMSTHTTEKGHLDFGNRELLTLLGFEYVGKNEKGPTSDPKRFSQEWKYGKKLFYSDGTWLQYGKNESIYYFNDLTGWAKSSSLTHYVKLPEDKMWIGEKSKHQLWKIFDKGKQKELLTWVIGGKYSRIDEYLDMAKFLESEYSLKPDSAKAKPKTLVDKYIVNIAIFGDILAELVTYRFNMHCMSGHFAPFILYLTPQCGEQSEHQILLNKFAEINKGYIYEEDEDDCEDPEDEDIENLEESEI